MEKILEELKRMGFVIKPCSNMVSFEEIQIFFIEKYETFMELSMLPSSRFAFCISYFEDYQFMKYIWADSTTSLNYLKESAILHCISVIRKQTKNDKGISLPYYELNLPDGSLVGRYKNKIDFIVNYCMIYKTDPELLDDDFSDSFLVTDKSKEVLLPNNIPLPYYELKLPDGKVLDRYKNRIDFITNFCMIYKTDPDLLDDDFIDSCLVTNQSLIDKIIAENRNLLKKLGE